MSAHTPGPWVATHRRCADGTYRTQVYDLRGIEIADLAWTPRQTSPGVISTDREANARLISAAPDMLAALRRAVLALAFAAESSAAMRDDYEAVSAAISKATGEAQ